MESNSVIRKTSLVRDLVLQQGGFAHLFERHGIDYCCQGDETLESACLKRNLSVNDIMVEIEATEAARPYSFLHGDLWDTEFLIEYIVENHHRFCKATIPVLSTQITKLIESHGADHPHLKPVAMLFERVTREIEQHMRKEEMILFPYIKSLASAGEFGRRRPASPFLTLDGPLLKMEQEHLETSQTFAKIRALLSEYNVPAGASAMYRAVVRGMQAFVYDVHQHMHLENNLLYPRALELDRAFAPAANERASKPRY